MEDATLSREDGRTLHFHDRGPREGWPVFWLHGTPNIGPPPEPLFTDVGRLGLRWLGYDRPGYGGSSAQPGRKPDSAAGDVAAIADRLGSERFSVMGHSGGASHALACAACLPHRGSEDRVVPVSHGEWLARHCPSAQLRRRPGDGHISVLRAAPDALAWLADSVRTR